MQPYNFTYTYPSNSNRLSSITNTLTRSQTYNYSYDSNGNIISDEFRNINNISYNSSNLPEQIINSQNNTINYSYDSNGNRIRKAGLGIDEFIYKVYLGQPNQYWMAAVLLSFTILCRVVKTLGNLFRLPPQIFP